MSGRRGSQPVVHAVDVEIERARHGDVGRAEPEVDPVVDHERGQDRVVQDELLATVGQLPDQDTIGHPSMVPPGPGGAHPVDAPGPRRCAGRVSATARAVRRAGR